MARKRMIDPGIWQSEDFSRLSSLAKLVFIGLFSNADDCGRGRAKAAYVKSLLFPYDEGMRVIDVDKTLSEIGSNMSVTFYLHDDSEYYSLDKWSKWQKIDKPSESVLPAPDEHSTIIRRTFDESSASPRRTFDEESRLIRREENRIRKEENSYCTEPSADADAPCRNPVATLTLNDKTEFQIFEEQMHEWAALYPAVDVIQQLRSMRGWLNANPTKRKTKTGILRFVNGWLAEEQNKGGSMSARNRAPPVGLGYGLHNRQPTSSELNYDEPWE